jgi:hypothetical protein
LLVGAYATCFLRTGWPTQTAASCIGPGGASALGSLALSGPSAGTPKTTLCHDILECVHQTNCTGGADVDNQFQCYCGDGVSIPTCINPDFTPTGVCADQMAAGLESSTFSTSSQYFGDLCLANGAAFFLYDYCDFNCCQQQCLGAEMGGEDLTYCNAPGSGGSSGAGGTTGAGGNSGTGGATHAGGTSGAGGAAGFAGNHGGTGGGGQGAGGATGATGGGVGSALQNVHFDTSTNGWTPTVGATAVRSTNDASGNAQSGSLDLSVTGDPTITSQAAASQCVGVTARASYTLGVKVLIPGQLGSQGGLGLWYYPSTDCSGTSSGAFSLPASTTNAWQSLTASTQIPANVHSASVRLQVLKPFGQSSAEALFDDVAVTSQ